MPTMPLQFYNSWRDSVFLICTASGCFSRMDWLNGMFLLPRTDLRPVVAITFCNKVGDEVDTNVQLIHLSYNDAKGMWFLEQGTTSRGAHETLAFLACANRFPNMGDRWHLVHKSFGDKDSLHVERWTLQAYNKRMELLSPSSTGRLLKIQELSRELKVMRPSA